MPVADLAQGPRIHVRAGLARVKQHRQNTKNIMSPASAQKTNARVRYRVSLGPRRGFLQSSSPPPPPPPVGRRSTGGLPPVPGAFRSISAGMGEKMDGIGPSVRMRLL